jgi:hypothetical protein
LTGSVGSPRRALGVFDDPRALSLFATLKRTMAHLYSRHLRRVRDVLQWRATAPGARHENPGRSLYTVAARLRRPARLEYPLHDWTATVTTCGRICFRTRKINLS